MTLTSSRRALRALGAAAILIGLAPLPAGAQGRCMLTFGTPACNTTAIPPVFEPTGWKTIGLDHITFRAADYKKEAAFYIALMGWKLRSDDGQQTNQHAADHEIWSIHGEAILLLSRHRPLRQTESMQSRSVNQLSKRLSSGGRSAAGLKSKS